MIEHLASTPEAGDVIPGTGGLRKLRWSRAGKGKRGGGRVIYCYHRPDWEVLLLTAYAKSEKQDLSASEKKLLDRMIQEILKQED